MPIYECNKCNTTFNYKKEYLRHINKKKKCTENQIYECSKCHKIYKYKSDYERHINKKNPCNIINYENALIKSNNEEIIIIKCNECNKEFTTTRSLRRHQKEYCNKLDFADKDELLNIVKELKQQIKDNENIKMPLNASQFYNNSTNNSTNNSNNISNSNIGNTINNTININAYGKEDLSHITDKEYKTLFTKCNSLIPA